MHVVWYDTVAILCICYINIVIATQYMRNPQTILYTDSALRKPCVFLWQCVQLLPLCDWQWWSGYGIWIPLHSKCERSWYKLCILCCILFNCLCLGNEKLWQNDFVNTCTSQQYSCQYTSKYRGATARGIVSVSSGDEDSLLTAVATVGPIAVYMDASHTSFQVIHIVVCTLQIHRYHYWHP